MKIIVPVIEGYSASIRPDTKTLSTPVAEMITNLGCEDFVFHEFHSSERRCHKNVGEWIIEQIISYPDSALLLVGKSYGGYLTHKVLEYKWEHIKAMHKICVITIDAHTPFPTFYGRFRSLNTEKKYMIDNVMAFNIYQQNKYPRGAKNKTATKNIHLKDKSVDHWNIIDNIETLALIEHGLNWLQK